MNAMLVTATSSTDLGEFRHWNRVFFANGALLVPIPMILFWLLRYCGVGVSTSEDLVTVAVMIPLGGPHVFATFGALVGGRERGATPWPTIAASAGIFLLASSTAVASAMFDARTAGHPPMVFLLTAFFFWAGLHVAQQHCWILDNYGEPRPGRNAISRWSERAVIYLALYPGSLFRMSMGQGDTTTLATADANSLATRIVTGLGADSGFADAYVFRIGRMAPILPDAVRHPGLWIGVTAVFATAMLFVVREMLRERADGAAAELRNRVVLAAAITGGLAPFVPSLDCAFQGINAWHCFQYLRLSLLSQRANTANLRRGSNFLFSLASPGSARRAWCVALLLTTGLVGALAMVAWILAASSNGRFVLLGHDSPPKDDVTGLPLWRPGAFLLAYYLVAFGMLLAHYLHDTIFFARRARRDATPAAA